MDVPRQVSPPAAVPPEYIRVMGEGDDYELCLIQVPADCFGGITAEDLMPMVCSHPDVQSVFPSLQASAVEFRNHVGRHPLRGQTRIGNGQTVHLCSTKGHRIEPFDDSNAGIHVYYQSEDFFMVVPVGEDVISWICIQLGLLVAQHTLSYHDGKVWLERIPAPSVVAPYVPAAPLITPPTLTSSLSEPAWKHTTHATFSMPDGSVFSWRVPNGFGINASVALKSICEQYKLDEKDYHIIHPHTKRQAFWIFPSDAYVIRPASECARPLFIDGE